MATGQERATLTGREGGVIPFSFSADGKTLASAAGGTIKLWDVATGKDRATLTGHTGGVSSLSISADGKTLASAGSYDKTIKLWDVPTGKEAPPSWDTLPPSLRQLLEMH